PRLGRRALDFLQQLLGRPRPPGAQERLDVVVVRELDEEVEVARLGSPDRRRAGHGRRLARRTAPVPSATPPSTSASPATAAPVTGSPRNKAPYPRASAGTRYVTRIDLDAPAPARSA